MSPAVTAPGDLKHVGGWVGSRDWLELVHTSPPVTELTGSRPSTRMFFSPETYRGLLPLHAGPACGYVGTP